jgi:VanZ family protein
VSFLSPITWLWSCLILLLGVLGRPLQRLIEVVIGPTGIAPLIWVLGSAIAAILLFRCWSKQELYGLLYTGAVFAVAALFAAQIPTPIERIHLIKYGVFGWLIAGDLSQCPSLNRLAFSVMGGVIVSTVDESLQLFIPDRVGDLRDVVFGAVGACSGGLLKIMTDSRR